MSSLKEKLAEKSASGSFSGCAKKTPSRVHAMLNDQLGTVDDEPESKLLNTIIGITTNVKTQLLFTSIGWDIYRY